LISIGYDHVIPAKLPEVWNLRVVFSISAVLGGVACGSSLLMLWAVLDSWNPHGVFHALGLPGVSYGQVTTMVYLKVSLSDFLTLFSARTSDRFFFQAKPAPILLIAACLSLAVSTILACLWPASYPDDIYTIGLTLRDPRIMPLAVWIYCIIWWFIQDILKVITYKLFRYFNIFDINLKHRLSADLGAAQAQADDEGVEEHEPLKSGDGHGHGHGHGAPSAVHPEPAVEMQSQPKRRPSEENVHVEVQGEKPPSRQPSRSGISGQKPVRRLSEAEMELVPAEQKLAVRRISEGLLEGTRRVEGQRHHD